MAGSATKRRQSAKPATKAKTTTSRAASAKPKAAAARRSTKPSAKAHKTTNRTQTAAKPKAAAKTASGKPPARAKPSATPKVKTTTTEATALLHAAIDADDIAECVRLIRDEGAQPNMLFGEFLHEASAVHVAAFQGNAALLRVLCEQCGGKPNCRGCHDEQPIHCAAQTGHVEAVQCLLRLGAKVNVSDECGQSPLFYASENGHTDVLRLLCQHGADVNEGSSEEFGSETPLHIAATMGRADVVQVLIDLGADVNATDAHDETPAMRAASGRHAAALAVLVAAAARVGAPH